MCYAEKKLQTLDKIVCNLSGKERKFFVETLQRGERGGSKGDQHEVFLRLFINIVFLNNNS